ncbi:F-box only protein 3-like [Mya arenaria]|uniref:F-box only protein 3-like n=1 Tax=Mya arenaria TaxID=6604 RepID=UPI0022E37821|nr:F-box only protein 3-like [Mya arenaria]
MAGLLSLPDESLLMILRGLHYKDLVRVLKTCRRLRQLVPDDSLWKWQCLHYFVDNECPEGMGWYEHFMYWYLDYGKYKNYAAIRTAWNKIEKFTKEWCPSIHEYLNDGLSEDELDSIEQTLPFKLPLDFRLSYRIHNGQEMSLSTRGVLGSCTVHSFLCTECLLPFQKGMRVYNKGSLCFTMDNTAGRGQVIGCRNINNFKIGRIYHRAFEGTYDLTTRTAKCLVSGDSFKEWLCDYADKLDRGEFFVDREHIFKFYHEPSCLATSHHITVKPTTMYVPSMSRAAPPVNFFAYRIIMEMPSEAPHSQSCRLTTRHWTVTDGNGKVERVTGEGVVGQNPVMKPGSKFAWISCTTFQTDTGSMEGYFMFTNLHTGAEMRVECPRYHMRALPSEDIRLKYAPNPHAQFWPDGIVFEDNLDDESDGENEDEDYMEDYMEAQEELYGIEELDSDDELDFMDPQEAFLDPHYVDLHQDLGDPYEDLVDPHEELEGEDEEVEDENEGENDNIHGNHEVENAENNSVEGGAEEIGGEDEVEDMGDENVQ